MKRCAYCMALHSRRGRCCCPEHARKVSQAVSTHRAKCRGRPRVGNVASAGRSMVDDGTSAARRRYWWIPEPIVVVGGARVRVTEDGEPRKPHIGQSSTTPLAFRDVLLDMARSASPALHRMEQHTP